MNQFVKKLVSVMDEAGSYVHETKSAFYQNKLDLVISGSDLSQRYLQSEVFLLEG